MRIIAGEFRSRILLPPPPGATTRPIPDRVKESLFSLLRGRLEGASVLDCFAGTGTIGLEAISRGAARCVLVEKDKRAAGMLRRNIEALGCEDRAEVVIGDALGAAVLARCPRPADVIFFDPPYAMVEDPGGWARCRGQFGRLTGLLTDDGFSVLRTPWPFQHREGGEGGEGDGADAGAAEDGGRKPGGRRKHEDERMRPPFRGEPRGSAADGAGEGRLKKKDGGGGFVDEEGVEWEEVEGWEAELAGGGERGEGGEADGATDEPDDAPPPPAPVYHPVDLTIEGTIGPETHIYGHTALHLYMKAKKETPSAGEPGGASEGRG